MLRFQPDSWLEGLLRPLLLADPVAGLYFEVAAPDWRFAGFFAFMVFALASRRFRMQLTTSQSTASIAMFFMFYVWTFVAGNGRYFIWGLVMIGPLLIMAGRMLPCSRGLRTGLLALVLAMQLVAIQGSYAQNAWGIVPIASNPVGLDESPLRNEPAVFLTMSVVTYSILVPRFHPESRWAGIAGQHVIKKNSPDERRLNDLLSSPLPKYLVLPLDRRAMDTQGLLQGSMASLAADLLSRYALALAPGNCLFLKSPLSRVTHDQASDGTPPQPGFWFCPVQAAVHVVDKGALPQPAAPYADVFQRIEESCPRFFPAHNNRPVHFEDSQGWFYPSTDVTLLVDKQERVSFKYYRAMNPTYLGTATDVRRGAFAMPCDKLPGRYVPPWDRG